jgi:hypothetical protein
MAPPAFRLSGGVRSCVPFALLSLRVLTAVVAGGQVDALAAQPLDVVFRHGFDSNVFQVPSAADSVRVEAVYLRIRARLGLESSRRNLSVRVRPGAGVDWFPENSRANAYAADLAIRVRHDWRNPDRGAGFPRRIVTHAEGSTGYERALLSLRQTREELQDGGPLDAVIAFAELPARARARGEVELRAGLSRRLDLRLGAYESRVEHRAPRGSPHSYDRLDRTERGVHSSLHVGRGSVLELTGNARGRDLRYPNQAARSGDGRKVDGVQRHYRQWDGSASVQVTVGPVANRWSAGTGRRRDLHEGYYDYREWELADELRIALLRQVELSLRYAQGRKNFERYALAGEPSRNLYRDATVTLDLLSGTAAAFVLGLDYERTGSNDPRFEFDRMDAFVEMRLGR